MAKLGRRGFTRSLWTDQKAHCVEAARSCQMLSRVITKQHHETVLIQCLNAMVGITRSKIIVFVVAHALQGFVHTISMFLVRLNSTQHTATSSWQTTACVFPTFTGLWRNWFEVKLVPSIQIQLQDVLATLGLSPGISTWVLQGHHAIRFQHKEARGSKMAALLNTL